MYSCEKELYEDGIQNSSRNLKITKKSFKDLLLENDFNKAYQKVQAEKVKSAASRTALEDEYNFTIDESKQVNVIEIDGKTIYNILIQRDTLSTVFFENLVLVVKNIDNIEEVSALIFKYNIPETLEEFSTDGSEGELLFGKVAMCIKACSPICTTLGGGATGPHVMNSNGCNFSYWGECSTVCISNSGGDSGSGSSPPGGSGTSSGGGTSGGGGGGATTPDPDEPEPNNDHGGGGSDDDEIIVAPVLNLDEEEEFGPKYNPCNDIKSIGSRPIANVTPAKTALTNLMDLKNNVTTNRERMYAMSPTVNSNGTVNHTIYTENFAQSNQNQDNVSSDFGGILIDILVHTHWDTTNHLSTFSLEDIYQIYRKIGSGQINLENQSYFTAMIITAHGTQYAMKFKNVSALVAWGDNYFLGWNHSNLDLRKSYQDAKETEFYNETKIGLGNTPAQIKANELGWAAFMQNQNVGMQLYRVNDTFTQFTKLSTTILGALKETPCGN